MNGSIRSLEVGNTEVVAEKIKALLPEADVYRIETVRTYSTSYMECIEEAKQELREQARPQMKNPLPSLDEYDTIVLGYPNWWGTMPMVCYTFLETYCFDGKRIIPFCTNEGSGMGSSERALGLLCRGCRILPGLSVKGCETQQRKEEIQNWAKESVQK